MRLFVVFVADIDTACLESLVNFAYSGELDLSPVPKTAMWPMLSACTELQMTDALNLCHDYMAGNVTLSKPTRSSGRKVSIIDMYMVFVLSDKV